MTSTQQAQKPAEAEEDGDDFLELGKALLLAAAIALTIRSFLFEPFNIPSGSMLPTLLVGDYLFVEKYSYGYSKYSFPLDLGPFSGRIFFTQPKRGDIAVFRQPKHPDIDYIKRIIGLPGDTIQMRNGLLYINGKAVKRDYKGRDRNYDNGIFNNQTKYIETLPEGLEHWIYEISDRERYDNTTVYTVPAGYYFAMGDNRDESLDSRSKDNVGFIPEENLIGRAWFLFFSTAGTGTTCPQGEGDKTLLAEIKTLACEATAIPKAIRYNRILKRVNSL